MDLGDLSEDALREALPGRAIRAYPAVLSTAADALAWARAGAPSGSLVVADYQASARGRAGLEWRVKAGRDLGFSLVLRLELPPHREGWVYTVATSALADVVGEGATIAWPDEVLLSARRAASVGVDVHLGPSRCEWAIVNVVVPDARPTRVEALKRAVEQIETRSGEAADRVLGDYLPRLTTLGRRVRARLVPMGPGGPEVEGRAVGALMDGALLIQTDEHRRIAVRPQNLGLLDQRSSEAPDNSSG